MYIIKIKNIFVIKTFLHFHCKNIFMSILQINYKKITKK